MDMQTILAQVHEGKHFKVYQPNDSGQFTLLTLAGGNKVSLGGKHYYFNEVREHLQELLDNGAVVERLV